MKEKEILELIKSKTKNELLVLAKEIVLKNYSRLNKNELQNLILQKKNLKKVQNHFKLRKPFYKSKLFIITTTIILPLTLFFFATKSSSEDFKNFEHNYLNNQEYLEYINELENLNTNFLKSIFNDDYIVVGLREEKFIKVEITENNNFNKQKLRSELKFIPKKNLYFLYLLIEEMVFSIDDTTGGDVSLYSMNCFIFINIIDIGKPYKINCYTFGKKSFHIVLLNKSKTNPVYAIGLAPRIYD